MKALVLGALIGVALYLVYLLADTMLKWLELIIREALGRIEVKRIAG